MPNRSFAPGPSAAIAQTPQYKAEDTFNVNGTELRPVAQVANSYIVAESEEGMVLIDQHAAHERVRYAQLMEEMEKAGVTKQPLLTPLEMDLGVDAARLVEEHREDFDAMGFEIEPFGGQTFLLRAVPAGLEKRKPEQIVQDILTDVTEEWKQNHTKDLKEFLLTYTACRSAIKFGDRITLPEMQALIQDMERTKHCTHCPHGRPAIVTLTFDSLETLFKRKNF
jgi:DNA mismatch repair protein MutL